MGIFPSDPKGKTALSLQFFVFMWNLQKLKVPSRSGGRRVKERDLLQRPEKE